MTEKQKDTLQDLALDYGLARTDWKDSNGRTLVEIAWEDLRDYVQELIDEEVAEIERR